jgi:hypothetical protein
MKRVDLKRRWECGEARTDQRERSIYRLLCDGASHYFSAMTSISKSSVLSLSFLEKAPSFAP